MREISVNVLVFTYNEVGTGQKVITLKLNIDKERNKQKTIVQNNVLYNINIVNQRSYRTCEKEYTNHITRNEISFLTQPVHNFCLRLWVRIPPRAWMFVCCECCQVEVSATS